MDTHANAVKDATPPARLQPRMCSYIPTNEAEVTVTWEKNCRDFAILQTQLLLKYWKDRIPTLQKDIKCIETTLKAVASRED